MSLPKPYTDFKEHFPELAQAFENMGVLCKQAGPLDARSARLVKVGVAVATGSRGGIKSQARKALGEGFTVDELRHAAVLALPSIGFAAIIAAIGWINEVAGETA
ncbi:MAG: carboxymuconolactone decarboxylase family protein [Deltaproteobacteria bacterium]|nr:carboxymuconolactone decarboxylase family protein [Deltaproteobacteria bacterium]